MLQKLLNMRNIAVVRKVGNMLRKRYRRHRFRMPLAALVAAGCGRKAEEHKLIFAFVPKLLDNPVFQVAWQGAQAGAKDLGGGAIEVQRFAPVKADAVEQAQIIEGRMARKANG